PKTIKSIEELESILGKDCIECSMLGFPGEYEAVDREGNNAVFKCSYVNFHRLKVNVDFTVSREKIEELTKRFKDLVKEEGMEHAYRKIEMYAMFGPENLRVEFDGYCFFCYRERPMYIEERKVHCKCSECASILADSLSG
ncbi:MAG: hypothetical protein QXE19_06590, partial [Candidatus Bathyarchaeia archaeon]